MENPALVRDDTDRKILILYVLSRLPAPIDSELLYEACLCDDGIGYFDYSACLHDLVQSGNITEKDDEYTVTEKGRMNAQTLCTSLPYSVRSAAEKRLEPFAEMLNRYSLIRTETLEEENGKYVRLSVSDGECTLVDMKLYCGSGESISVIRKNFRRNAETVYRDIYTMLTGKQEGR